MMDTDGGHRFAVFMCTGCLVMEDDNGTISCELHGF